MRKYLKQDTKKRIMSLLLAGVLAASAAGTGPVPADAEDAAAYTGGPCGHHTEHTQDCGYAEAVEGQPCGHQHTEACYILTCGHQHDAACGYVEAEGAGCTHVHTEECYTLDCPHEKNGHDGTCGYTEAVEGKPCGYVCGICSNPGGNGSGDGSGSGEDSGEKEPQTGQDTLPEAVQKVQTAIEGLPSADEVKAMGEGERAGISAKVQEIKASYEALAEEERALLPAACSGKLEALSAYLENQIAAGSPAQSGSFADAAPGNGTQTCTCTEACTETAVNTGCPACAADVSRCTGGKTGAGAAASGTQGSPVEQVQALIDVLPTAEAVAAMTQEEQGRVYDDLQAARDAYEALTDEQKAQIRGSEIFDALFAVFNGMADTLDDTVFITQANSDGTVTITGVQGDQESITTLTIPAAVNVEGKNKIVAGIGVAAFSGCTNLSNVTFAEGSQLKTIKSYAFEDCSNLGEINIPGSVESIEGYAFRNCSSLKEISIPGSVGSLASTMFNGCSGLKKVILQDGIKSIPGSMFANLSSLEEVSVPGSVESIGNSAFEGCGNLVTITFAEGSQLKSIKAFAFDGCSKLGEINIPRSVESIESYAFRNCSGLKKVILQDGIKSIPGSMFANLISLEEVSVPGSVESIGSYAFDGCGKLVAITFAEGSQLKSIGSYAFRNCSSLGEINIPGSVESIESYAFWNCSGLKKVILQDGIKSIPGLMFRNLISLEEVSVPGSVESIGNSAFEGCGNLVTITFAEGSQLKSIEVSAFNGCSKLGEINIPGSVESIEFYAFEDCTNLSDVTFAEESQLKSIRGYAFNRCSSSLVLWHYGNTTVEEYANTNHLAQADINKKLPVILTQPQDASYAAGSEEVTPLTVEASVPDGDTLSYQWYSNTAESNDGGTMIDGETDAGYTPPVNAEGAVYYYCIVKNTFSTAAGERSLSAASEAAAVTVTPAPAHTATVNGGSGSGQYRAGDTVTVTAGAPAEGQQFSHWTVDQGGAALADANSAITTFIMPAEAVTVTAHYTAIAPPETEETPAGPEPPASAETEEAPAVPETEPQPAVTAEEKQSARKKLNQKVEAGETYNRIRWARVEGADGYIIYGSKCSSAEKKHKMKALKTITSGRKTSWTHKGLKENTWYKYRVSAYKLVDGEKVTIGSSVSLHSLTQGDSRYANPSRVKVSRTKITLKKGKSTVIKAEAVLPKGKKTKQHTAEIRYVVSDPSIVSVSKNGKIKGKKKGSCTVYAVAQNGVYQKIKVKVK